MIARNGPLQNLWYMWYEATRQHFKSAVNTLGSFVNTAHTLLNRQQMRQCHLLPGSYLLPGTEILGHAFTLPQAYILPKSGKHGPYSSLPVNVQKCLCYTQNSICSVNDAAPHGCSYAVGAAAIAMVILHVFRIQTKHLLIHMKVIMHRWKSRTISFCRKLLNNMSSTLWDKMEVRNILIS